MASYKLGDGTDFGSVGGQFGGAARPEPYRREPYNPYGGSRMGLQSAPTQQADPMEPFSARNLDRYNTDQRMSTDVQRRQQAMMPNYYPDASMGNPQAGMSYAQVLTPRPAPYGEQWQTPQQAQPAYAARSAPAYPARLQQMVQQQMGSAVNPNQSLDAYRAALPAPNQIVARNWMRLPNSSREFLLGTYEALGYDPGDVEETIQRTAPTWRVPRYGMVRR